MFFPVCASIAVFNACSGRQKVSLQDVGLLAQITPFYSISKLANVGSHIFLFKTKSLVAAFLP